MRHFYLKKLFVNDDTQKENNNKSEEDYVDCINFYNEWYECIKKNRSLKIEDFCEKLRIDYLRCLNKNK